MKQGFVNRLLNTVEKVGNRLPDPTTIFVILTFGILFVSWFFSVIGISATHPADGKIIEIQNLLSRDNIQRIFVEMSDNFAQFPPLATVLVTIIGIGVAEKSGLIGTALKKLVTSVPKQLLTATLVFGAIMMAITVAALVGLYYRYADTPKDGGETVETKADNLQGNE